MQKTVFSIASVLILTPGLALASSDGGGANPFAGDFGNALWTLVVFGAVVLVLGKFAWGPLLENLQAREDFIHDALAKAKADRDAAEARLASYEAKLATARAEATAIVEEGRRDAEEVKRRVEASAQEEADKTVARAKREISIAQDTAVKAIYQQSAEIATALASRVIRKELDAAEHERLIAEAIGELSQNN